MVKFIQYFLVILLTANPISAMALVDITCLKYDPALVAITGLLEVKTFPGEPSFLSIETGDTPETGYYIEMKPPICTITRENNWMLGHEKITRVQLVMSKSQYEELKPNLGRVVSVKGMLFEAFNQHHHTQVLLDVKGIDVTDNKIRAAKTSNENIIKPSVDVEKSVKTQPKKLIKAVNQTKNNTHSNLNKLKK